jgi:hypothetical protein
MVDSVQVCKDIIGIPKLAFLNLSITYRKELQQGRRTLLLINAIRSSGDLGSAAFQVTDRLDLRWKFHGVSLAKLNGTEM